MSTPAIAPTLLLSGLTARDLEAAAEALEQAAAMRVTAARRAAGELEADDATPDKRTGAVRVTKVLAEADALERVAEQLRNPAKGPARVGIGAALVTPDADGAKGDAILGLSAEQVAEARRVAAAAIDADAAEHPAEPLEDPDPAAVGDVDTGSTAEDEAGADDEGEAAIDLEAGA